MILAQLRRTLLKKLEEYEGRYDHMYADSKGKVTVGVGHLLASSAAAESLAFVTAKQIQATKQEIASDYKAVLAQTIKGGTNQKATAYKSHTALTLSATNIDNLTNHHIDTFGAELRNIYHGFSLFPVEAQLALFDMVFNLGATGLRGTWPNMNAAIRAKDWSKAAIDSNRVDVNPARNRYVRDLFNAAANRVAAGLATP